MKDIGSLAMAEPVNNSPPDDLIRRTPYDRVVEKITKWVKPYLHNISQDFIHRAVNRYAKDNPRFAKIIEFEVRSRGDGVGLSLDVAEPLLWIGVKTVATLAIAIPMEFLKNKKFQMIERVGALGIIVNNGIELFRLVPRYKAGLYGSLEKAVDRWNEIEESGNDAGAQLVHSPAPEAAAPASAFANDALKKTAIEATTLMQQAEKVQQSHSLA